MVAIIVVVGVSALLGLLLALPSRRLVGDYLAIVTLFFGQIFFVIVNASIPSRSTGNWDLTGGPNGIANIDPLSVFGFECIDARAHYYSALAAASSYSSGSTS